MGSRRNRAIVAVLVVAAVALAAVLAWVVGLPALVAWLLGWSVATFAAYGIDKTQARRAGWRIPELGLHGLAIAGGAAGGWLGMAVFHHKIRHGEFLVVLAVATALQVGLLWVVLTAG